MSKIGTFEDFRKFAINNTNAKATVIDDQIKKADNMLTPYILEERQLNVATFDVFSRLMPLLNCFICHQLMRETSICILIVLVAL